MNRKQILTIAQFAILAGILAVLCAVTYSMLRKTTEKYYCAG